MVAIGRRAGAGLLSHSCCHHTWVTDLQIPVTQKNNNRPDRSFEIVR